MRRLAIGMLTLVAGLTLFGPGIQAQDDDRRRSIAVGRIDVLQVSGFIDPILVDAIDDGDRPGRRRRLAGTDPAGQQRRHRRRRRRGRGPARARRHRPDPDRHLGRAERRPLLRHRRPAARRGRRHRHGTRRTGRLHRRAARPARPARGRHGRLRRRRGTPAQRLGRPVRRPHARGVQAAHRRRGHPDDHQHGGGDGRLRGERRRAGHHRTRRARRRLDPIRHRVGRAVLEADPASISSSTPSPARRSPTCCC